MKKTEMTKANYYEEDVYRNESNVIYIYNKRDFMFFPARSLSQKLKKGDIIEPDAPIVCECGNKKFSVSVQYDSYKVVVICDECGNKQTVYDG